MDMIGNAPDLMRVSAKAANASAEIFKEARVPCFGNPWLAISSGENEMVMERSVRFTRGVASLNPSLQAFIATR